MKHDTEKDDWSILPLKVLRGPIRAMMYGEVKYERDNYQHVKPPRRYWSALLRHAADFDSGEYLDGESKLSHLWHMGACLIFLLWFEMYKGFNPASLKEKDDRRTARDTRKARVSRGAAKGRRSTVSVPVKTRKARSKTR